MQQQQQHPAPSTQQEHSFHANVFGLKVFWYDYFNRVLLTFISYLRVNYLCISSLPSNGQSVQVTNTFFTPFVFTKFSLLKLSRMVSVSCYDSFICLNDALFST